MTLVMVAVLLTVVLGIILLYAATTIYQLVQQNNANVVVGVTVSTTAVTEAMPTLPPIGLAFEKPDIPGHLIEWEFTAHLYPCFMSQIINIFPPQHLTIIKEQDGWALTYHCCSESDEALWVYIASDRLYVNHISGTFDEPNGRRIGRIPPQVVNVLERYNRWVKISTYAGDRWLDLDFTPPAYELEYFMQQFGGQISIFYENMASGFTFSYNPHRVFFGASATKLPFAIYIYLKTEAGYASMNSTAAFIEADFWEGSGVIRHRYQLGTVFNQQRLLNLMLVPSDNIATRMLRRMHGLNGYREWVESIGANPEFVHNLTYSHLSAYDSGIFLRIAYEYINSGGRYSHDLKNNMLANRYAFITSDHPVASKSGWAANHGAAWHDMALVFAPSPYSLSLLSSLSGNYRELQFYRAISMAIQEFNDTWF